MKDHYFFYQCGFQIPICAHKSQKQVLINTRVQNDSGKENISQSRIIQVCELFQLSRPVHLHIGIMYYIIAQIWLLQLSKTQRLQKYREKQNKSCI